MEAPRRNPYVGPRAFQTGEALYGRDGDILNLYYLLLAERVVLLFSPSGAGKSSLIQAGLIPRLQEKFAFIALIRVNQEPPEELAERNGFNRYVFSTLSSLEESAVEEQRLPAEELAGMSLVEYLTRRVQTPRPDDESGKPIFTALIFDQFEEVLTSEPNDYEAKRAFFDQLGEALRDNGRWALFSAREDYAAAFEPYLRAIPTRFANRYRLDLLEAGKALEAIQKPALEMGVEFSDAAAQQLVDDLRRVQIQRADGSAEMELGRYVEPVQLQVVCYRLWNNLSGFENRISEKHIAFVGSVDESLSAYYSEQVTAGSERHQVPERIIREWFNRQLITQGGMRGQVMLEPEKSSGLDNAVIRFMESAHLVRAEKRAGSTWFELAHDRLIEPIRADNENWLAEHLSLLQQEANLWNQQKRPDSLLLREKELAQARLWAAEHDGELLPYERDFLAACKEEENRALRLKRRNRVISILGAAALFLALLAFFAYRQADVQRQEAQRQARFAQAGQLAAQANTALGQFPQRSLLLAIEANHVTLPGEQRPASAEEALRSALKEPHGLPLAGHEGPVNTLAFSPRGDWLATGSEDHNARLWKIGPNGALKDAIILAGHSDSITSLAFSPDQRWLATGSADDTARLWDLGDIEHTDHPIVLRGHTGAIYNLAFSPDQHWLATGSEDETLRLWDLSSANPSENPVVLKGEEGWIQTLAFSPSGRWLAGGGPHSAWLWDLSTGGAGARRIDLPGHTQLVQALAFSPSGRWLATGSQDQTVRLWDLSAPDPGANPRVLRGHGDWVNTLAFSPDGNWLATGSGDRTARLWDMRSADPPANPIVLTGHSGAIKTLAFSPSGSWLATGSQDGSIRLWNLAGANPAVNPKVLSGHDAAVNSLAFSPDTLPGTRTQSGTHERWLASGGSDNAARLWDLVNADPAVEPAVIGGSGGEVNSLAFSADSLSGTRQHWLAAGGGDDKARLWDLTRPDPGSQPLVLSGHSAWIQALAFSPDMHWLATGSGDHTARLWDLTAANPQNQSIELAGHQDQVKTLAFSPSGRWLATGSADHSARLWDLSAPDPSANPKVLAGHEGDVNGLAFSPRDHWLATGSADNTVRLWDLTAADPAANPRVLRGHQDDIFALAFSPDMHWLATGSGDHTARLWDLTAANPEEQSILLAGHQDQVKTLAFSPDSHWLATGSWDKTVRLWDMRAANPAANPRVLAGHEGWVNTLAFSPGDRWLATGSEDHTARLWDLDSPDFENNPVVLSGHEDAINSLAFSPDGRWLATGSRDKTIRLWLIPLDALISQACGSVGRNLSQKEWQQFFPGMSYHKTCPQWPDGR